MFEAKYASKCANGHSIKPGDFIAYDVATQSGILCQKCTEFYDNKRVDRTPKTSNKFCPGCFTELPIAKVTECPNCEIKLSR